ncbi:MAG: ATP-binding protein, partial [Chloroflexota bacterium]|nr:ATP-binding protein [Chloroflexota bacterium]
MTVNQDRIVVQDDGFGMSLNDINTKYLRFGYEKRRELTILSVSNGEQTVERHVMGRKGIGKISALSIARELELQTVHGDERNGFVIDLSVIEQLQVQNSTE